MLTATTEPIPSHWTTDAECYTGSDPTASDVTGLLAPIDVADIDRHLVAYMSAAAAELALLAGVAWRFSPDDPPVALIRMIARVSMRLPHAGGPHTARLFERLCSSTVADVPSERLERQSVLG